MPRTPSEAGWNPYLAWNVAGLWVPATHSSQWRLPKGFPAGCRPERRRGTLRWNYASNIDHELLKLYLSLCRHAPRKGYVTGPLLIFWSSSRRALRSSSWSLPSFRSTRFFSIVVTTGLITECFAKAELDIAWGCIIYPGVGDKDLVKEMARAGCTDVSLGFESGSDRMLVSLHKPFDSKAVRNFSSMLADNGIGQMGFQLLAGRGETKESVMESFTFVDSLPLDMVKVSIGIRIYPHTALARMAVDEGVIAPDDDLLQPRFYIAKGLEGWLRETAEHWMKDRPHWYS